MPVGYGLSETCAFVASHRSDTPRELARIGHGRLLPGTRLRVVDPDTGAALGPEQDGELAVAGETLMLRYLGAEPEDCFDADGFLHTGDAGRVDAEGIVHWSGRRTEMIKTGGANVSPAEIEVALRACPAVKLSRVVGVPDERLGQVVAACVVRRHGAAIDEDGIRAFLRERVATYKVPRHVLFFAEGELPMTAGRTKVRDEGLVALVRDRLDAPALQPTTGDR
jgi:acyl-CoA synthetase (AMP-forming)/AMP-acid ligase II